MARLAPTVRGEAQVNRQRHTDRAEDAQAAAQSTWELTDVDEVLEFADRYLAHAKPTAENTILKALVMRTRSLSHSLVSRVEEHND